MALAIIHLLVQLAVAEYRVFELVITNQSTGQERVEISTLDPNQYPTYYPIKAEETVTYRSTWRCRGNTSKKPVCSKPETADRNPPQSSPNPTLDPK